MVPIHMHACKDHEAASTLIFETTSNKRLHCLNIPMSNARQGKPFYPCTVGGLATCRCRWVRLDQELTRMVKPVREQVHV